MRSLLLVAALLGVVARAHPNDDVFARRAEHHADISTLEFVQVVWRHGDRTPAILMPTDKANNESTWEGGLGELTLRGMAQQYRLGKWIRERYEGFLSKHYSPFEIFVRSSDYNRTLVSAQANLAGLFEPSEDEQWLPTLKWRPIPVHTVPKPDDKELYDEVYCPVSKAETERVYNSDAVLTIEKKHEALLRFIAEQAGVDEVPLKLQRLWNVYDPIYVESVHNESHTLPSWLNETVREELFALYDTACTYMYHSDLLKRLRGGPLLKAILTRMHEKAHGLIDPRMKLYAYSAHDTSVAAILAAFGIVPSVFPHYATAAIVELHRVDGEHLLRLFYKNGTDLPDVFELQVVGCEEPCTLDKAMLARKHVMPHNWKAECGRYKWYEMEIRSYLATIAILAFTTLLFGTILLVNFVYRYGKHRLPASPTTNTPGAREDQRALLVESDEEEITP